MNVLNLQTSKVQWSLSIIVCSMETGITLFNEVSWDVDMPITEVRNEQIINSMWNIHTTEHYTWQNKTE